MLKWHLSMGQASEWLKSTANGFSEHSNGVTGRNWAASLYLKTPYFHQNKAISSPKPLF
jgi:hypothetical protein